jgi:hypothetical protein
MCHESGGIGPVVLDNYEAAANLAPALALVTSNRSMPPWMLSDDCHPMHQPRKLSEAQIETIAAWAEAGAPEGDPALYQAPEGAAAATLGEPDLLLDAGEGYVADPALPDDYRCLLLDHTFSEETFVVGLDVKPGQKSLVHHVLLYVADDSEQEKLAALDAASDGPGYQCFGGPQVSSELLGGWVPGSPPFALPNFSAFRIPTDARIVMQVHYNLLPLAGALPDADQTQVKLWTLPAGETPERLVTISPLAHSGLSVAAGDPNSVQTHVFPVTTAARIEGIAPHMHLLGKSLKVELLRKSGDSECVVDVPEWDFNWQQFYLYREQQALLVLPGDELKLTCVYDNSAANQPVINGEQQEPGPVQWGEGTLDEMCLNYLLTTSAYIDVSGQCLSFPNCLKGCLPGDSACFLGCVVTSGADCPSCLTGQASDCGGALCSATMFLLNQCLQSCELSSEQCLLGDCAAEFDAAYGCVEPKILSGECDDYFGACGVGFGQ